MFTSFDRYMLGMVIIFLISFVFVLRDINYRTIRLEEYLCAKSVVEYYQGDKSSLILHCKKD